MNEQLTIVLPDDLENIGEGEIGSLISQIIESSKDNTEEMCQLAFECTTLLSASESRITNLNSQSTFKRIIRKFTGKNSKMRDAIMQNNTNALYAAQEMINMVMRECTTNRELLVAVNDRISGLYTDLKKSQIDTDKNVLNISKAIVTINEKFEKLINEQNEYEKSNCPKCRYSLLPWQKVCPNCGEIHPLKVKENSERTKKILEEISKIIKDDGFSEDIVWDKTAQKTEKILQKVKALTEVGKIQGYTEELATDINVLINKCKDAEFQIAVVGVMKAGKSFLMNALIGAEVASVDVNPETAALTKFRSANGYYVIVKFHNDKQWEELKKSAEDNDKAGKDSLTARLKSPNINELEGKWIGHDDLRISCKNLNELQTTIKNYTSSQKIEHLFVSEVEVGIDKSVFEMPNEVVFVDTPGLKDPVKYRSDITKNYIKKADAVLIALKPGPFTAEGVEVVTTVLDYTETDKAYIIGTQKDLNAEDEREKYVFNWIEHLTAAKRYPNKRSVKSKIILTSAKMYLLAEKWSNLSEKEKENDSYFDEDDYNDLESFSGKVMKRRGFNILQMTKEDYDAVYEATGIPLLRETLEENLISKYRELKIKDIERTFIKCKKRITAISQNAVKHNEDVIESAISGKCELTKKIEAMIAEKEAMASSGANLKKEAEKLENSINEKIKMLERGVN